MEPPAHTQRDRIIIAQVSGTAAHHAVTFMSPPGGSLDSAVAELRSVTVDAHLLGHGCVGPDSWLHEVTRALLEAAGADVAVLDADVAWMAAKRTVGDLLVQWAKVLK